MGPQCGFSNVHNSINLNDIMGFDVFNPTLKILGWVTLTCRFKSGPRHHKPRLHAGLQSFLTSQIELSKMVKNWADWPNSRASVASVWPRFSIVSHSYRHLEFKTQISTLNTSGGTHHG